MRKSRLHPYPAAVLETLRRRRLLVTGDRVLVALSGGPDSTALLVALAELRDANRLPGDSLAALHVDHGLRPDSAEDAAGAAALCGRLGVPFEAVRVTVGPGNLQAQARRARYAALRAAAARHGCARIATGHTRTDQAETVLLRLLRGAGARGLAGIPPRRGIIVRPLIERSRAEGLEYLAARGIAWRSDPTNDSLRFARNRVRHTLWPAVTALAPAAERALARTADLLRDDERALAQRARRLLGDGSGVEVLSLQGAPVAVRRRAVRDLWARAAGRRGGLDLHHVEAVLALARKRGRPGSVALPDGYAARCRYGRLEIVRAPRAAREAAWHTLEIPGPGRYALPGRPDALEVAVEGAGALSWPLALRTRQPGDRFRPQGGNGSKTLKRWLIDRKVPRERREQLLILASGNEVIAIPELALVSSEAGRAGVALTARLVSG